MRNSWKKRAVTTAMSVALVGQLVFADASVKANGETNSLTSFEKEAVLSLKKTADSSIGTPNPDGGVAEIVAYNSDNQKAYVVNGQEGVLNVLPMNAEGAFGKVEKIEVKELIEGFAYGDMTSVSVDPIHDRIAVALQAENYADNGQVAVLDYEGTLLQSYEVGVQPDMVTFTKDGNKLLSANEGEPREGYGEGTIDPAGSVSIVDLENKTAVTVGFEDFDSTELAKQGILFNKVEGTIVPAETDLEPEYIAVNQDGSKAYISLQEANAVAVLDLAQMKFTEIKSLGFQDYSKEENAIDLEADEAYVPRQYENALGVRMPDGISIYEKDGKTYLLTANEGDAREWGTEDTPQYFINESKTSLTATDGTEAKKVRVLDKDVTAGLQEGKNYLFGSRSFSIFDVDTMEAVYDSANGFEAKTAELLPDFFNCSNDDIKKDSRSQKKGPEPESVIVGAIGERTYAFVALERIGGVMVYDVTDPLHAAYVNYVNTRDFSSDVAGDVAPEGLAFIPATESANGQPMIIAACEVSGTVAGYTLTTQEPVPTAAPTTSPETTAAPTTSPETTAAPTASPETTAAPTASPETTAAPTASPFSTVAPTTSPETTVAPTTSPVPTVAPTASPVPTVAPTASPVPTAAPTASPVSTAAPARTKAVVNKVAISSLKNTKGRKATLKWKKVYGVAGYQVQYSYDAKFKKKKVLYTTQGKATLKKLKKGKKLYVRIRVYNVKADGKKAYGIFSKVKSTKIKK